MWRRGLLTVVLILAGSTAFAQTITAVDVSGLADGKYVLEKAGSVVSLKQLVLIKPGVIPDDPTTPSVDRANKFRQSAEKVGDLESAKNLMALYRGMAQKSRPPDPLYTTPQQLQDNIRRGTDIFLMGSTKASEWTPFRELLTAEWVQVAREGGGMEDYAKLLDDVSQGLEVASGSENAVFDITMIFKILEILGDPDLTRLQKIGRIIPLIIALFAT